MKTTVKALLLMVTAFVFVAEAAAQQVSATTVVDQHYATQSSKYRLMMIALAGIYAGYVMISLRRKRSINRILGKL